MTFRDYELQPGYFRLNICYSLRLQLQKYQNGVQEWVELGPFRHNLNDSLLRYP